MVTATVWELLLDLPCCCAGFLPRLDMISSANSIDCRHNSHRYGHARLTLEGKLKPWM